MKDFPRFSEAHIQTTLTQPQMKLALSVLSHFRELLDTSTSTDHIKSFLANAQQHYTFKFPTDYDQDPNVLKIELEAVLDHLLDTYCLERYKHQDAANAFLHDTYLENFDPETFDLPHDGLKVAENG